ncbi:putative type VI secretion system effector [Comamonas sp. GB3 AK4-5]|uniref:putative type VI secretion system effector n=1 Tax=Comamonas sp. GB3 AK4-5 TaxID=3231487 RepID=UPI00351EF43D
MKTSPSTNHGKATVLLKGRIENYRASTQQVNFFEAVVERKKMAAASAAAALAGMGGIAVGTALLGSDDMKEDCDLVEFELNGKKLEGYLWLSPFQEGDHVEVAAEPLADGRYFLYGMCRPLDKIIALAPHCTRGKISHYWMSLRFYSRLFLFIYILAFLLIMAIAWLKNLDGWMKFIGFLLLSGVFSYIVCGIIAIRVSRKYLGFVEITESVLSMLGWKDPARTDLPRIHKRNASAHDTSNHGSCFFRYDDSVFTPAMGKGPQ